jgi:hypothetical protein
VPEASPPFVRIDRDRPGGGQHQVVHLAEPQLLVELTPDRAAPNGVGRGVIRRVCVPNSWAGDYGRYARLLTAAQDFFGQSQAGGLRR